MSREARVMRALRHVAQPALTLVLDCALIALSCAEHAREQWSDRHRTLNVTDGGRRR